MRMPRHVENAQAIAEFLEQQPQVEYVNYPGLKSINIMLLRKNILATGAVA